MQFTQDKKRRNHMDGRFNTPSTVCRVIIMAAIAAAAIAVLIGCTTEGGTRRQNIAQVIQTAYDLGGREAVSNRIESLVTEGKLTPSRAVRLHALTQLAYEGIMDDLERGGADPTDAVPASASQDGCGDCSVPDASIDCGDSNEDAYCGECEDCKADE